MRLIIPDRPDIPGYVAPSIPGASRCGALWGWAWPADPEATDWRRVTERYLQHDQLIAAVEHIRESESGGRAVMLVGHHANTDEWSGNPPAVGSLEWHHGWFEAIRLLAARMVKIHVPHDTLIICQSEHYPLMPWLDYAVQAALPYSLLNYWAHAQPEAQYKHSYAPGHRAGVCLYAADHKTYSADFLKDMLLPRTLETVCFVTEPVPGDEANWHKAMALARLAGVRRCILFADHRGTPADLIARRTAIEAAWAAGNWTGGDIRVGCV